MTLDLTARYAAAERLLPHQSKSLLLFGRVQPHWIKDCDRFRYRDTDERSQRDGIRLVLDTDDLRPIEGVAGDSDAIGLQRPAFDVHVLLIAPTGPTT